MIRLFTSDRSYGYLDKYFSNQFPSCIYYWVPPGPALLKSVATPLSPVVSLLSGDVATGRTNATNNWI